MKVTVIATGFVGRERKPAERNLAVQDEFFSPQPSAGHGEPARGPALEAQPLREAEPQPQRQPERPRVEQQEEVPFYRKVIAQARGEDPGGFGPNWSNVDDFDIPTVLRKQMD